MLTRRVQSISRPLQTTVRMVSDKSKDGAVKEEGGSLSKKGEADENAFFHKLGTEQLKKIKDDEGKDKTKDSTKKSK